MSLSKFPKSSTISMSVDICGARLRTRSEFVKMNLWPQTSLNINHETYGPLPIFQFIETTGNRKERNKVLFFLMT